MIGADDEAPNPSAAAAIEVTTSGGIAGRNWQTRIDSTTARLTATCEPASACPPGASRTRSISRAFIAALYGRSRAIEFRALAPDYGVTADIADGRTIILTIRGNGTTRTVRGDDGTLPTLAAQFVNDIEIAARSSPTR